MLHINTENLSPATSFAYFGIKNYHIKFGNSFLNVVTLFPIKLYLCLILYNN